MSIILKKLISFYKPEKVYLFGSQARDDANENKKILLNLSAFVLWSFAEIYEGIIIIL
ncbi:hypothetical protein [Natranaerofaba carboxydovora]|uniref:hypothetical protein n=1 Tax=Natranaerofaba carboxydovora TaxID=2742683 RepID=UPI001F142161|nr:hypothetical protein [Natranaerofaba carboxydovora]UMZ72810.1 hypothetical protein ACONDI_00340 [Natranaerofaba carboxydovora]